MTPADLSIPPELIAKVAAELGDNPGYNSAVDWTEVAKTAVGVALVWQAENPRVPSAKQVGQILEDAHHVGRDGGALVEPRTYAQNIAIEWMRIAYLKPKLELPAEVRVILKDYGFDQACFKTTPEMAMKIYELGRAAK